MHSKINSILGSPFIKNTLKLSSSSVILMFLPLVVTPILARLYSPDDYGVWGVFSSVLSIVNSFIFLSYENTIVKTSNEKEVNNLLALCFLISSFIILIVGLIFIIGKTIGISFFVNFQNILLLTSALFVTSIYNLLLITANRVKKYGAMSISNVINGSFQAIIRIFLGMFPIITYGLIVGNIFAQIFATIYIILPLYSYIKEYSKEKYKFESIRFLAIKYKKFPLYDAPARFIEFSVINLVIIVLSNFFGRDEIGYFSMVIQFILLPISIIGAAMGNVYYKELSENFENLNAISSITRKVAKMTFIISLIPILFLTFGGDKILVIILGDKWIPAGNMALILAIYSVPVILSQPLLPAFRTLDKQEIRFKLNIVNFILAIGSLIVAAIFFTRINIVLFVYSISYAIVRFWIFYKILKITNLNLTSVSKHFIIIIFICYTLLMIRMYLSDTLLIN